MKRRWVMDIAPFAGEEIYNTILCYRSQDSTQIDGSRKEEEDTTFTAAKMKTMELFLQDL
jgi:hypothetical protein